MATREENEILTRTGPGTSGGEFWRRYWQPAALSEELPGGGAPLPIRLLGEDLVLFRDPSAGSRQAGSIGCLGIHCSHRGADLSYGRLEDGGLRCIYHGWLYDVHGRCLEQPGEPALRIANFGFRSAESAPAQSAIPNRHSAIKHLAYPCHEQGGMIFAYLGSGEPPCFPAYEFLMGPDDHRSCSKYFQDDNYLQGSEGNVDPAHLGFLHRFFRPDEGDFLQGYHQADLSPTIDPVETDFGLHVYAVRKVGPDKQFVKVRALVLPALTTVGSRGADEYLVNWHVPIDDEHHWRYGISFNRAGPLEPRTAREARQSLTDGYRLVRNKANRYLQDREEMKTQTFIGLGRDFVLHDTAVTESQGQIYDRTQEHLGYTDRGIVAMRRMMMKAIHDVAEGLDPPGVVRDPAKNHFPDVIARDDVIPVDVSWRWHWKSERRLAGVAG